MPWPEENSPTSSHSPLIRGRVSSDALKNAGILPLREEGGRLVMGLASPGSFPAAQVFAASFGLEAAWGAAQRRTSKIS